ncbi:hypothetical protein ACFQDG_05410 [Natronoarchaeum mannanilyticum]
MDREESDREFVVVDDDPDTDFVIVEEESADAESRRDDELVAVPDADARYPGLVPVESLTETGFVIVDEPVEETDFVIVEDAREDGDAAPEPAGDTELALADATDLVLAEDADPVLADEDGLVPADDETPTGGTVPNPFVPDLFRPGRGS